MIDIAEMRFWELYKMWCETHGEAPTTKGYIEWMEISYE